MAERENSDPLLEVYLHENSQLLEQLEQIILECEELNAFPSAAIHDIFRIMHTIKGSSTMMNFDNIAALSHIMEDLFAFIREHQPRLADCTALSELVLQGGDFIKLELYKIRQGDSPDGDASSLKSSITGYLEELKAAQHPGPAVSPLRGPETGKRQDGEDSASGAHLKAVLYFDDDYNMENVRAYQVVHSLQEMTEQFAYWPEDIAENPETASLIREQGFQILFRNGESADTVAAYLSQAPSLKHLEMINLPEQSRAEPEAETAAAAETLQPIPEAEARTGESTAAHSAAHAAALSTDAAPASPSEPGAAEPSQVPGAAARTSQAPEAKTQDIARANASQHSSFISVNLAKLDELMDLVGELVIAESMVTQNPELAGLELEQFQKAARHLRKITGEIQDKVMSIRMVPLVNTFQKMNRIVRDMCRKQDKSVRLELLGEDTEVDKNIIEHISDPIMHLVRNAIDHGIETPEERLAAGKEESATLTLEAKNVGNEVFIIVRDDGRGLNKAKILQRARERQMLFKDESEMSDREIYNLIFLPGFSTKEVITEYSGRGVGMDVVMRNIESVGGNVSVDSAAGEGTTITIRIPLTLAIIDGMNVKVGKARYTIPTTAIKESFRAAPGSVVTDPDGNEMVMVRGQCYGVLRLYERYKVKTEITAMEDGILIMVEQDGTPFCVFADELLGQQQVVVKSLPAYIRKIRNIGGLAGCTMLGDGSISLILDVGGLVKASAS
ncbi:MAG: chemotaxis protein CheA [Paenibacillus macerans]|uniref:chemotaxis protein CheA n=1 Tax=Paenibacillus TaxID=44249 RepID=UPI00097B3FF5|nr:chemotaxis protein CheA [Paenibacillus macerans]MDU7475823.1 chemotaxis protein CheA [Paenibacillus macerans]MEC0328823.1 chemotaxis protein CheA [Paenibacillus macerans]OMG49690.1 chemotaxis protein CheA [Paenibacillus macerans]